MIGKIEKRTRRIPTAGQVEDRISALPDEIIHQILALLRRPNRPGKPSVLSKKSNPIWPGKLSARPKRWNPNQPVKLSTLSKRWNQVWRSDPILTASPHRWRTVPNEAVSCHKFFQLRSNSSIPTESVRIVTSSKKSWPDGILDDLFDLTAKISPREIDIDGSNDNPYIIPNRYRIPKRFLLGSDRLLCRLQVLKLDHCDLTEYAGFGENPFVGLGSSLKVIQLNEVALLDDRLLNSLLVGASLLEELTLKGISGIARIRIPDRRSLKSVTVVNSGVKEFEIVVDSFAGIGSSLRVLCLDRVIFRDDCLLNNLIAGAASVLEELTLQCVIGIGRIQIRNHRRLKFVKGSRVGFEIIGTDSLKSLNFDQLDMANFDFDLSSMRNVKKLDIKDVKNLTEEELCKLISKFPSLESLTLHNLFGIPLISIRNSRELRGAELCLLYAKITINAPCSTSFFREENFEQLLSKLRRSTIGYKPTLPELFHHVPYECLELLKQCLVELSEFKPTVECLYPILELLEYHGSTDDTPTPVIECLMFPPGLLNKYHVRHRRGGGRFLDYILETCHPKSLHFVGKRACLPNKDFELALDNICNRFAERAPCTCECEPACFCWDHQLRDVKLATKIVKGSTEEVKVVDFSEDAVSRLAEGARISFILTWD